MPPTIARDPHRLATFINGLGETFDVDLPNPGHRTPELINLAGPNSPDSSSGVSALNGR